MLCRSLPMMTLEVLITIHQSFPGPVCKSCQCVMFPVRMKTLDSLYWIFNLKKRFISTLVKAKSKHQEEILIFWPGLLNSNPLWSFLAIPSVTSFIDIVSGAARGQCDFAHSVVENWYYEVSLPPGGIISAANQKLKSRVLCLFLFFLLLFSKATFLKNM